MKSSEHGAEVRVWTVALCAVSALACGGDAKKPGKGLPWQAPRTQVITSNGTAAVEAVPEGDGCVDYGDACLKPQDECGPDVSSDVILADDGSLLEVICYPKGEELTVSEVEARSGDIAQNENDAVVHIGDGVVLDGELAVDANNVVIYGSDPERASIEGSVRVDGNNIIVHGLRIRGDVEILANNAFFVHCVIEGDLTIRGNNAVVSGSDVLGATSVLGNNAALTGNDLVGPLSVVGKNTSCEANFAAEDTSGDGIVDERVAPLDCN